MWLLICFEPTSKLEIVLRPTVRDAFSLYCGILTPQLPGLARTDPSNSCFLCPVFHLLPWDRVLEEPEQGHHHLHVKKPFVSQLCAGVGRFMG